MFRTCVKRAILGQCNSRLVVAVNGRRVSKGSENFLEETTKPDGFFAACVAATYSASVVESITSSCFFEDQETAPSSNRNA